ncbi:MAG: monovalent cation/H+ antiporter complex subunit F [Clostridia bacterium]|nr:monovalent cation/H+ antiporter complex subunit F [Clostridia bacterium]
MVSDQLLLVFLVALVFIVFLMLYRVLKGPTVFDRLNGLGVIGTDAILILILIGFLEKRVDMYIDIAISYGILGFISLVVIAKYFDGKGDVDQ